jgi:cytochrome c nitrite reductase small subunit
LPSETPLGRARVALIVAASMFGIAAGLAGYTFLYARGASYLTNDPRACTNCHVMNEQYAGWVKGSHRAVATCNDCHTPPGFPAKYWTKAQNGFWHSFAFTTGRFDEPIRISPRNRAVTERACRHCHGDVVQQMDSGASPHATRGPVSCLRCHTSVGHFELAATDGYGLVSR